MVANIGGIKVTALVDPRPFEKGMAKLKKKTDSTLKGVQKAFKNSTQDAKLLGDRVEILGKSFSYAGKNMKEATVVSVNGIKQQAKATEQATKRVKVFIKWTMRQIGAVRSLAREQRKGGQGVPRGQKRLSGHVRQGPMGLARRGPTAIGALGGGGGIPPIATSPNLGGLKALPEVFRALGGIIPTTTQALGNFFLALKVSVARAADFEEEFAVVRAITTGSAEDFKTLRFAVQDVANSTEHASNKVLKAATVLGRAGFQAKEIGEALKTVGDLATAGSLDISAAAELSVRMLRSFGMELKDLRRISNMLATASASANVTIRSLAEGFKFTGAIAETVGLEFSDVTTALSLLGETGLEAGLAGRALQAMIMDLSKPSNQAKITLGRMGIMIHKVSGEMLSMSTILRQLKEANMSAADSFTIFNRNSARAVTALVRNISKYDQFETTVTKGTTALEKQSETIRDTYNKQLKALGNNVDTIAENIGRDLLPQLTNWVKLFKELTGWFSKRQQAAEKLHDMQKTQQKWNARFQGMDQKFEHLIGAQTKEAMDKSSTSKSPLTQSRDPQAINVPGYKSPEVIAAELKAEELRKSRQKFARELASAISEQTNLAAAIKLFNEKVRFTMIDGADAMQKLDVPNTLKSIFQGLYKGLLKREGVAEVPRKIKEMLENILAAFETSLGEKEVEKVLDFQRMVQAIESWRDKQIKALEANARAFEKEAGKLNKKFSGLSPAARAHVMPELLFDQGYGPDPNYPFSPTEPGVEPGMKQYHDVGPDAMAAAMQRAIKRGNAFDEAEKASDEVWNGLKAQFIGMMGSMGTLTLDIMAASAGGPWAMLSAAFMNLMNESEGFQAVLVPLEKAFTGLVKLVEPFMEPLFRVVDLVAQVTEGIANLLVPVMEVIAKVINVIIDVVFGIINAIIWAINKLLPEKWELDMVGENRKTFDETMADLNDETEDATDNFADLNATLIESANVASGFKTNLRAFQAALIDSTGVVLGVMGSRGGPSGPRPIGFHAGGVVPGVGNTDSVPAMLTPGETVIPRGGAAGGIVIHNMHVHVADTKDFMRKLTREREWQTLVRTGSPIKGKLYGAR